ALVIEGAESPYVNVVAVRTGDEANPALLKLADALTRPEVRDFILERYEGAVVPVYERAVAGTRHPAQEGRPWRRTTPAGEGAGAAGAPNPLFPSIARGPGREADILGRHGGGGHVLCRGPAGRGDRKSVV